MHTIEAFYKFDNDFNIIVVLPKDQHGYWEKLISDFSFTIPHEVTEGGKERFYSVKNGLKLVGDIGFIAVHDGVRPLVGEETINNCFNCAKENGAAIPVMPATESIRKINAEGSVAVNRSEYFMVQTPQVFKASLLLEAYKQDFSSLFTDDASVVENLGHKIHHVDGNAENIKITLPRDIKIAEALIL